MYGDAWNLKSEIWGQIPETRDQKIWDNSFQLFTVHSFKHAVSYTLCKPEPMLPRIDGGLQKETSSWFSRAPALFWLLNCICVICQEKKRNAAERGETRHLLWSIQGQLKSGTVFCDGLNSRDVSSLIHDMASCRAGSGVSLPVNFPRYVIPGVVIPLVWYDIARTITYPLRLQMIYHQGNIQNLLSNDN